MKPKKLLPDLNYASTNLQKCKISTKNINNQKFYNITKNQ